jgi:hypothetical protein
MPLKQLNPALSDGQKVAVLKRFRAKYSDELEALEVEMQEILTSLAEAEFLAQYVGEQPEVLELRARKPEFELKEKRRQYLGKIIERLDACIPDQKAVTVPPPAGKAPVRRY